MSPRIKQARIFLISGMLSVPFFFPGGRPGTSAQSVQFTHRWDRKLTPGDLDAEELEKAIIFYTNQVRRRHNRRSCVFLEPLHRAARKHSLEMARLNYFAHESPVTRNRDLQDRVTREGVDLINTMIGENLGVDYFRRIANVPFITREINGTARYYNADTMREIPWQTYREFARNMVDNWMKSSHHRDNILQRRYIYIGIGAAQGTFQGLPALYITQVFQGPVNPR
jgi:uncharacterized protein YkwD